MDDYCELQLRLIGTSYPPSDSQHWLLSLIDSFISLIRFHPFWLPNFYEVRWQVVLLRRQNKSLEALNLIIEALKNNHFGKSHTQKWWILMRTAVSLAQDLHLNAQEFLEESIKPLLALGKNGPQPWKGYDVAYSFATLSIWSLELGKTQEAIDEVTIAIHADPLWAHAEYLLGCYGLLVGIVDPVIHFSRAVQIDKNYLTQLNQDPLIQKYPEILKMVQEKREK